MNICSRRLVACAGPNRVLFEDLFPSWIKLGVQLKTAPSWMRQHPNWGLTNTRERGEADAHNIT